MLKKNLKKYLLSLATKLMVLDLIFTFTISDIKHAKTS